MNIQSIQNKKPFRRMALVELEFQNAYFVESSFFSSTITDSGKASTGKSTVMAGLKASPRQIKGRCNECNYFDVCGGNTRVRAQQLTGDPWQEDPACYLSDEEIGLTGARERVPMKPYVQLRQVRAA